MDDSEKTFGIWAHQQFLLVCSWEKQVTDYVQGKLKWTSLLLIGVWKWAANHSPGKLLQAASSTSESSQFTKLQSREPLNDIQYCRCICTTLVEVFHSFSDISLSFISSYCNTLLRTIISQCNFCFTSQCSFYGRNLTDMVLAGDQQIAGETATKHCKASEHSLAQITHPKRL